MDKSIVIFGHRCMLLILKCSSFGFTLPYILALFHVLYVLLFVLLMLIELFKFALYLHCNDLMTSYLNSFCYKTKFSCGVISSCINCFKLRFNMEKRRQTWNFREVPFISNGSNRAVTKLFFFYMKTLSVYLFYCLLLFIMVFVTC
jgi:hypothetical protein